MSKSALSCASLLSRRARARTATSTAVFSRKLPASSCSISRERASRSKASSPAQARRRNASRSSGKRARADCRTLSSCFQRLESIGCPSGEFAVQPHFGDAPIPSHRNGRDFEDLGCLLDAEPAKKTHFDDQHFTRINSRQGVHRVVECDQILSPIGAHQGCIFKRNVRHATATFQVMPPCILHQNAPHYLTRNCKKMGAILPLHALVIDEAHVSFIDQGGSLKAMTAT